MTKYTVETIGKVLVTLTDKDLAKIFFEQRKDKYSYLTLNEVREINGNTYLESIAVNYR